MAQGEFNLGSTGKLIEIVSIFEKEFFFDGFYLDRLCCNVVEDDLGVVGRRRGTGELLQLHRQARRPRPPHLRTGRTRLHSNKSSIPWKSQKIATEFIHHFFLHFQLDFNANLEEDVEHGKVEDQGDPGLAVHTHLTSR